MDQKVEAARSLAIALKLLAAHDLVGSKQFAERAISMDPELPDETAEQIIAVADVLLSSQNSRVGNHPDWYSILNLPRPNPNLPPSAPSDFSNLLQRNYRRLVLLLHPDRNKLPHVYNAFDLVIDAYIALSDPSRKSLFDAELRRSEMGPPPPKHASASASTSTSASTSASASAPAPASAPAAAFACGFFPPGFPASQDSEWKPFVLMFPLTACGFFHLG